MFNGATRDALPTGTASLALRAFMLTLRVVAPAAPAVFAFLCMRLPSVSGAIGAAAVGIGGVFPSGRVYFPPGRSSVSGPMEWPLEFGFFWITEPMGLLVIAAMTLGRAALAWVAAVLALAPGRRRQARLLGSIPDFIATLGWVAAAAFLHRFYWGLTHDRLAAGLPHIHAAMGPGSIGMMWLGAAMGCLGTAVLVLRRRAERLDPPSARCGVCGYSEGPSVICPECGHDRTRAAPHARVRWVRAMARRHWVLIAGVILLGWPYLIALVGAIVPGPLLVFVACRMPEWW